ncbi:hypothetical protein I546_1292 [Mycobacterium kansasii 732]|nr:hypothetical protein I546_1292 [Mycobacterium kansasii 732]KZS61680.1 hypothetical protein A4G27_15435 [Mycobacterium kansasii]
MARTHADEWMWKNVKTRPVDKTGVTSNNDLKTSATNTPHRLHKQTVPGPGRGIFRDPNSVRIAA